MHVWKICTSVLKKVNDDGKVCATLIKYISDFPAKYGFSLVVLST